MKKIIIIILAIILAIILSILTAVKLNTQNSEEGMPDIEQVETVTQEIVVDSEETTIGGTENSADKETTKPQKTSIIKKSIKKVIKPTVNENFKTETAESLSDKSANPDTQSRFTPEEEELLKKVPRSDEVVVDKEIKIKSSGKYIFR